MKHLTTTADWNDFLKNFADASISDSWPGNVGATEEKLSAAEKRLKVKLPPSYRAFLAASNGWRNASRAVPVLQPVEKIQWFKREHKDWVQAYTAPMQGLDALLPAEIDYFDYTQDAAGSFDVKHLAHTLCVSAVGDSAVLLLNPMVVWPDGEWEAWFFANWLPGANRYRSFADWMSYEAAERHNDTFSGSGIRGELPTVYLDGPTKEQRRIRPREEVLTLEQVRKRLQSKTRSRRVKAVQHLCQMGGSDAIAILLDLLKNDYDFHVRCEAAESLGKMRATEAVESLIAQTAEYNHVTSSVIRGLAYFNDERSAQCLIKLVEANTLSVGVATHALAGRKDSRGVKPLVNIMLSKDPKDQHNGRIAGRFIAQFEAPGFEALETLVTHSDEEIRERAILGVWDIAASTKDKTLKSKACDLLLQCFKSLPEGRTRQWLASCLEIACGKNFKISENPFGGT